MSVLLPLEEAQQRLFSLATRLPIETVPIGQALDCYLASDIAAHRDQPAADMSAMDGYAIRFEDRAGPWTCVGECKAGSAPCSPLKSGETARIFTGALLPGGADTVVMQENVETDGNIISLIADRSPEIGRHVRRKGSDFRKDDIALSKGTWLSPAALGHAAIAGYGEVPVHRKPKVAIVSTGDELIEPGTVALPHQIPASNDVMVSAMLAGLTGETRSLSRIADNMDALCAALDSARDCDIIVTIGGASVGDHDLVAPAFERLGGTIDFHKIAMKPGKPVMSGKLGHSVILALPGNPGSAFVSATLFLSPLVRYMSGAKAYMPEYRTAPTTTTLPPTQNRAQFLRAQVDTNGITAFNSQDSAKLSVLAAANALLYRAPNSDEAPAGSNVSYISI